MMMMIFSFVSYLATNQSCNISRPTDVLSIAFIAWMFSHVFVVFVVQQSVWRAESQNFAQKAQDTSKLGGSRTATVACSAITASSHDRRITQVLRKYLLPKSRREPALLLLRQS
mmetsp:Transcript_45977/g.68421  ORF Transcript_45977/g.68421 Transcript_45977/m.68421 type:complete len:114 (-) Transcript_45977:697-1038(-)